MQLIDSSVNLLHLIYFSAHIPMLHVLFLSFGDRPTKQSVVTDPQVARFWNGSPSPVGGEGMAEKQADNHDAGDGTSNSVWGEVMMEKQADNHEAGDGTSNSDTDDAEEALVGEEVVRYD